MWPQKMWPSSKEEGGAVEKNKFYIKFFGFLNSLHKETQVKNI